MGVAALAAGAALGLGACGSDEPKESPLSSSASYRYGYDPGFEPDEPVLHVAHVLRNNGPETVAITGIEPFPDTTIMLGRDVASPGSFSAFEPFELPPEESQLIAIASALPVCARRPSITQSNSGLIVRLRVGDEDSDVVLEGMEPPYLGEERGKPCIDPTWAEGR